MPCTQTGSFEGDRRLSEFEEGQVEITKLAQLLCTACKIIESYDNEYSECSFTGKLKTWWNKHKKLDEIRVVETKQRALKKLTKEEIKLLGLDK